MWGYQRHFRSGVQRATERALVAIGFPAEVRVLLVGLARGVGAAHPICVEPEDGLLRSSHLMGVQSRAVQLAGADPEGRIHHSHPLANQRHGDRLRRKVRAQALAEAIAEAGVFPGLSFFASNSTAVGEYVVHTCVGIEASVMSAAPSPSVPMIGETPALSP